MCASETTPVFSVIVPTYNRAHLLGRSVTSVLVQTFTDFELIIVDDGSTDDTENVVANYRDPRVRYLYQLNAGSNVARNTGVNAAKGNWICVLDSDDEASLEWLATLYSVFQGEREIGVVCCGATWYRESKDVLEKTDVFPVQRGPAFDNQTFLFLSGTYAVRRDVLHSIGGYAANCPSGQHTELALRLIPYCLENDWSIEVVPVSLAKLHDHSGDKIRRNYKARLDGSYYIFQNHQDRLKREPQLFSNYCASAGVCAARLNRYGEARSLFINAIRLRPSRWRNYGRLVLTLMPSLGQKVWIAQS